MTPVRITFTLRTPMVVPSVDKALDGPLSWAAVRQAEFEDVEDPLTLQHDIGIAKHVVGDQWCFMASNLAVDWVGDPGQVHYIKRSRLEDYVEAWDSGLLTKRPAFDGLRGLTKAGSFLAPVRWAKTVSGYAVIADMDRLNAVLPWVTHIGKLWHRDYGAVEKFNVTVDPAANEQWMRRNLPLASPAALNHATGSGALVSPYWMRKNHQSVAVSLQ